MTLTTTGYGDLHPESTAGKMFTTLYVFAGFVIFTYVVGAMSDLVKEAQARDMHEARKKKLSQAKSLARSPSRASFSDHKIREMSMFEAGGKIGYVCLPLLLMFVVVAFIEGNTEDWGATQAAYFTALTATTVGFGVKTPGTTTSRALAIFYIPTLVICLTSAVAGVFDVFKRIEEEKKVRRDSRLPFCLPPMLKIAALHERRQYLTAKPLFPLQVADFDLPKLLESCPKNLDGEISKADFVFFMLHATGKASQLELLLPHNTSFAHSGTTSLDAGLF